MTRYSIITLIVVTLLTWCAPSVAQDRYEGTWNTTNRKLDGRMTCVVREVASGSWEGRFYGVWNGQSFDYTVPFTGDRSELRGTANIDGADYTWRGVLSNDAPGRFKGTFTGSRYEGYFDLQKK
jgi:hypothetical protein